MSTVRLGRTGIIANKNGFGALPIQRISAREAGEIMLRAYEAGVNYFDTARAYTDSEEKIGLSLAPIRDKIYLATKSGASTGQELRSHLETSLRNLKTDYIDVYQLHNPETCPSPGDGSDRYETMLRLKEEGKIKHIAITNHRLKVADEAVDSGLYDLLQYPFSYLSDEKDMALVDKCAQKDVGFVAMKALSGGLITNGRAAYAFMARYPNVLPIWGVQRMEELEEFIACGKNPPSLEDEEIKAAVAADREQLVGEFCRGCAYCMPCPMGIEIFMCARMSLFLRRAPVELSIDEDGQKMMAQVEECIECGQCKAQCPYQLDTPALLKRNLKEYKAFLAGMKA